MAYGLEISRRALLTGAVSGSVVVGVAGSAHAGVEIASASASPAMQEHTLECDVLVAGGGAAGVPCALAAARNGARVVLVQDRPVLGGNASSECRLHVVGANCSGRRGTELATEARESGILEEIRLENCVHNAQRSASMHDFILYDKCRSEKNLTLLLNTTLTAAKVKDGVIEHVVCERQSTQDRFVVHAGVFVDCTGDGRLGVEAGASFAHGREAQSTYGEKYAQPEADEKTLGSTILFQARKHNKPMPFTPPAWARKFTEEDLRLRPHPSNGDDFEYGYWWLEWGGQLDTIKDNERIRDELLALVLGMWDHIKNGGDHGADNWALEWFGFIPAKRESRRFAGLYTLVEQDLLNSRAFDDAIAFGGWQIDLHPPDGPDAKDAPRTTGEPVPYLYDIPLRACVSRDVHNLMFAGRTISASHVAHSSTRVMGTCAVVGQGVGTAAAYAARARRAPAELPADSAAMRAIQQLLLRDDAYLIGLRNQDPGDMAPRAAVSASSAAPDGDATNVVSGQNRAVHGPDGSPPDRALPGLHRWMSLAGEGLPAWIELRWDAPVELRRIQLIFDTGLHRVLTLRHYSKYRDGEFWGMAQPETVRDYRIEGLVESSWELLAAVKGNYERRRVHEIEPKARVSAIRIVVEATNGLDHARICEIRVY